MANVFVSYAHPDYEVAKRIVESLQARGWRVWWDRHTTVRQTFPDEIEAELQDCEAVIVLWSSNANRSRWVKEEANYALIENKLVPVVIDDSNPPFGFQLVETTNLEGWRHLGRGQDLDALMDRLRILVPDPPASRKLLFGRESELTSLLTVLDRSHRSEASVVLISGEPGVGKTALAREFELRAIEQGMLCLYGRGNPGASSPFQPIIEALIPNLTATDNLPAGILAPLNELLDLGKSGAKFTVDELELDRQRLFVALSKALLSFTRLESMLITLDDAQWIDESSLSLIDHLVFATQSGARKGSKVVFVLAYRPDELAGPAQVLVDHLQRRAATVQLDLFALSDSASTELAESVCGGRLSDELLRKVLSATRGNPLFIEAVLGEAFSASQVQWKRGYLAVEPGVAFSVPKNVAQILLSKIDRLRPQTINVLNSGIVLGGEFQIGVVAELCDIDLDGVVDAVEELERANILRHAKRGYEFAHPLYQQIAYERMGYARRSLTHLKVSKYLAAQPSADPMMVAHHLLAAEELADPATVSNFCERAGERALQMFAWDDAVKYYEAYVQAEESKETRDEQKLAGLHHQLGAVCHRHGRPDAALRHYQLALEYWDKHSDLSERARVLDDVLRWHTTYESTKEDRLRLVAECEEILTQIGDDAPGTAGRILETLATFYSLGRNPAKGIEYAERALALALASHDYDLAARLSTARGLSSLQLLDPQSAAEAWQTGLSYARKNGDEVRQARCLQRLPMPYLLMGEFDQVRKTSKQAKRLNYVLPRSGEISLAIAAEVSAAVLNAEWTRAEELAAEAAETMASSQYYWAAPTLVSALVRKDVLMGQQSQSSARFAIVDGTPFEPAVAPMRSLVAFLNGADASFLESARNILDSSPEVNLNRLASIGVLVEAALLTGRHVPELDEVLRQLVAASKRGTRYSLGWPLLIQRAIAGIHQTAGRTSDAMASLLTAFDHVGPIPRAEESLLLIQQAHCARLLRRRRDWDQLRSRAKDTAISIGVAPFVERMDAALLLLE